MSFSWHSLKPKLLEFIVCPFKPQKRKERALPVTKKEILSGTCSEKGCNRHQTSPCEYKKKKKKKVRTYKPSLKIYFQSFRYFKKQMWFIFLK